VGTLAAVDDFVAVKASDFNKSQQQSTSGLQRIQYQLVGNSKFQQVSIRLESGSGPAHLLELLLNQTTIFQGIERC